MKANMKIREKAKIRGVRLWQIADALNLQESMFSKKLRKELTDEEKDEILAVIDRLAHEKREAI